MLTLLSLLVGSLSLGVGGFAASAQLANNIAARQESGKMAFAHFIVGIVASYQQSDWVNDMNIAKGMGLDAFALNIGTDSYTDQQLTFAYAAAESVGFKVFISFDFSSFNPSDPAPVAQILQKFSPMNAQLQVNGKAFVSSFIGDGFPFRAAEGQAGVQIFSCPFWQANALAGSADVDCGFQWNAWPSQNNLPVDQNFTADISGDQAYISALSGKAYMAAVSPWFFTHYPPSSYNKNYLYYSDYLWQQRWDGILQLQPQFLEVLTWNDFGESHYIGPLHDNNQDLYAAEAKEWVPGFTHDAWRDLAALYIAAYKSGQTTATVANDELIYYYRPSPKTAQCSDSLGPPNGSDFVDDSVYVITMLTAPGTVVIQSGSNAPVSINVPAGITTVSAPMGAGQQSFSLTRTCGTIMQGTGAMQISDTCTVNNYNAFVDSVKASPLSRRRRNKRRIPKA